MTNNRLTRRGFGQTLIAASAAVALPAVMTRPAHAADTVRGGLQIGAMGALRTTLPAASGKHDITFEAKDFRDSTAVLLALEQNELDIGNTTTQHLIRAISENIPVRWVCGWGGGYNVLVTRKGATPAFPGQLGFIGGSMGCVVGKAASSARQGSPSSRPNSRSVRRRHKVDDVRAGALVHDLGDAAPVTAVLVTLEAQQAGAAFPRSVRVAPRARPRCA